MLNLAPRGAERTPRSTWGWKTALAALTVGLVAACSPSDASSTLPESLYQQAAVMYDQGCNRIGTQDSDECIAGRRDFCEKLDEYQQALGKSSFDDQAAEETLATWENPGQFSCSTLPPLG